MRLAIRSLFACTLLVGVLAVPASAKTPTAKELALDLYALVMPPANYEDMINQMAQQMSAAMPGKIPADKLAKAVKEVVSYKEILEMSATTYAKYFSPDELRDMINFYKTPTGRKAARLLPKISAESMGQVTPLMMERLPAALKRNGLVP